ncbi:MAG: hypothetical protein ABIR93_10970 [Saprospiraceae bacterium]
MICCEIRTSLIDLMVKVVKDFEFFDRIAGVITPHPIELLTDCSANLKAWPDHYLVHN